MNKLEDINFEGKNVLIRCDYNVPLNYGEVVDEEDDRIEFSVDTIRYVINQKANFILLVSHLGRPEGGYEEGLSLEPVKKRLKKYLGYLGVELILIKNIEDIQTVKKSGTKIALLENIRFWKEEEESNDEFAQKITNGFDVYVNNAFPVSHRNHSSLTKFPKYCSEKCAGKLFVKEIENLGKIKENPERPSVAIIGGAKIETKLPVIENLTKKYDYVLVGGKIANEALDQKISFPEKVLLPVDFGPEDKKEDRLDIGPKTRAIFIKKIQEAKTILWNGPMGLFEKSESSNGTREIISAIAQNKKAFRLIGGGETISALNHFSSSSHFDYVSMSGGAMLDYLANKELPGLKALE